MAARAVAYLSLPAGTAPEQVGQLTEDLHQKAARAGWKLTAVFTDKVSPSEPAFPGFFAMTEAVRKGRARHVVVPSLQHLTTVPGDDGYLARYALEADLGVSVTSLS